MSSKNPTAARFSGGTLIAMAARDFEHPQVVAESKTLLRQVIRYHLDGKPLNTRRILQDLKTAMMRQL